MLSFDHAYRMAQLPLVSPGHPEAIEQAVGHEYLNGYYSAQRFSLVVPIAWTHLAASDAFQSMDAELRTASFAPKISWSMCRQRQDKLHVTIASSRFGGDVDRWASSTQSLIRRGGPFHGQLRGPFIGDRNFGRIYFAMYPQIVDGDDAFALIQDAVSVPRTRLYTMGYYHLTDHLDQGETADLGEILKRWQSTVLLELAIEYFAIHATNDDLALSGRNVIAIDGTNGGITSLNDPRHGA